MSISTTPPSGGTKNRFLLIVLAAVLASCATVSGRAPIDRAYDKPFEVVWKAALNAVAGNGLEVTSANMDEHVILAHNGMSAWSYGEQVAVVVEPLPGGSPIRVYVTSRADVLTNIFAENWKPEILASLDRQLRRDSD